MQTSFFLISAICVATTHAFWDIGTSTVRDTSYKDVPRQARWRWPKTVPGRFTIFFGLWGVDWMDEQRRRGSDCVVGITIGMLNIATGVALNKRCVLTSANPLEPFMHRQEELKVWALGRAGKWVTPWRYRVWRVRRILPRSWRPEHQHGPRGRHSPRHDLAVVHTLDQIYIAYSRGALWRYPYRALLPGKRDTYDGDIILYGAAYLDLQHIRENWKISFSPMSADQFVNCETYLPKWWGKFVCMRSYNLAGTPSGGVLIIGSKVYAVGSFMITYDEDRILVFTDLRYYYDRLHVIANFTPGEYYEYAYPEWSAWWGLFGASWQNSPSIPTWQVQYDVFPLGK